MLGLGCRDQGARDDDKKKQASVQGGVGDGNGGVGQGFAIDRRAVAQVACDTGNIYS